MRLAQQALEMNDLGRAQQLLKRQSPGPAEKDLRGWEWRYLWSQARADDHEVLRAGGRSVMSMSFSGDGRYLAWAAGSNAVLELATRHVVFEREGFGTCAFAHRVPWLAYTTREDLTNYDTVYLLHLVDVAAGKEIKEIPFKPAWGAVFAPDDRTLVAVSGNELKAIDIATGQALWQNPVSLFLGGSWLDRLCISPDGSAVALAVNNSKVTVFEVKDGTERFTIQATDDVMTGAVRFSPDNSMLLTTAAYADPVIRVWDAHDGHALGKLEGHRGHVTDLIFTPDGRKLISSSGDYTIRLWAWPERLPAGVLRGHVNAVDGLALTPDGKSLASCSSDGAIFLWDLTRLHKHGGSSTLSYSQPERAYPRVMFSGDGRSIVQLTSSFLSTWDAVSLERSESPAARLKKGPVACMSPDGTQIVSADWSESLAFKVLDAKSGLEITNLPSALPSSPEVAAFPPPTRNPFAYLQDGGMLLRWSARLVVTDTPPPSAARILVLAKNRTLLEAQAILSLDSWDTRTWRQSHREYPSRFLLQVDGNATRRVTFLPLAVPGFIALTGYGGIIILNVNQTNLGPRTIENPRPGTGIGGFAASPDGSTAAIATEDGYVTILDWKTLKVIRSFKGFLLGAHSVAYSPDGLRLAVGGDGNEAVKLWATSSWEELLTLRDEGSLFASLQFSPDGRLLVAANELGRVCAWSSPTAQEITAAQAKATADAKQP